ncbi:MAG: thioredoxin domain-containing protein [Chloroflexi bacterium]|nr:thioredoxin domain-containing protein [Chloroflexota bacterium]
MPNRLANETSPYLLQHANNPVDWYPWGDEALERAREEDKPILLSVGYSACHWCHVMERESFENADIAAQMNDRFVSVKVDREERPDIDSIYMTAVQAMTGHGGWPMTVFLTPDGKPFYGGTYFPPEERGGMPSFPRVLEAISDAYRNNRSDIMQNTEHLLERMRQMAAVGQQGFEPLTDEVMRLAMRKAASDFDDRHGGFGLQPKFPQPMTYEFLLRHYLRTEDADALHMVELTLQRMAMAGIYDQIGGGFHRYSTDNFWLVPHFEKMLYDNALLVRLYLHAYQITGNPMYRRIVEETLEYIRREMTSPEGGFYSAQDADSEGVEGKFFIWLPQEIEDALSEEDGDIVCRYYGVTPHGNFEGRNILRVAMDAANLSRDEGLSAAEFSELLTRSRDKLLEVRNRRIAPGLDDKILTSWNGLTLAAFAEAAAVLGRDDYADIAEHSAEFLLANLLHDDRLLRTYKDGTAKLNGYLEDYAFLIDGLLALHEVNFSRETLDAAITLGNDMIELFWDTASGQFFDTGHDHEQLVVRPKDLTDNAIPCGSSMAVSVLLRLAVITGDGDMERRASEALRSVRQLMMTFPTAAGTWLGALDFYLSRPKEVAIIGGRDDAETGSLLAEVYRNYVPNRILLCASEGDDDTGLPLLTERRKIDGKATAYVCENYVCQLPVTDPQAFARLLVE